MCKCAIEDKLLSSVTIPVPYYGNYYAIFQVSLITKTVLSLPTSISSRTIVSLNKDRWKVSKPKQDLCWRNSVPCRYNWKDPRSLSQTKPVYPGAKGKRSGVCFLVLSACPFSMEILLCKWAGEEAGTIIVQYLTLMFLRQCFHFRWNGAESLPNVGGWP